MKKLAIIVLAGGLGTRMKSLLPKVLHPLAGKPLLSYPVAIARAIKAKPVLVVVPPRVRRIHEFVHEVGATAIIQSRPLGTAHAVAATETKLKDFRGCVVILSGDVPLLRIETVTALIKSVEKKQATLGLTTMRLDDPGMYGRIVRDRDGEIVRIVEARDASSEELNIREVNAGVYCVDKDWLFDALRRVKSDNAKQEYYLPDILSLAVAEGKGVTTFLTPDPDEVLGINTRVDLARVGRILRRRINHGHMLRGVTIWDEDDTSIDEGITIGEDTTILPTTFLVGKTKIGRNCLIEHGVSIKDTIIGDGVTIKAMSVVEGSRIAPGATIGPFARIRPESVIGAKVRVGNFVEIKKSVLCEGAKANHLTYLGDASVGKGTNVGCGTITCNYDGHAKHRTIIGEKVFVGSDVQFVAPVRVGAGATIGAGSTITGNVPAKALALARAKQVVVKGWRPKWKRKKKG
ncbi:MAG: bifunctional UDP-N-acetylglucosamine diphosphorylase/glucosamine-1-phosphate N-acetyltransferase GlmU [Deltaproteobacteria bacterium]|nr:bifunctional UDP-N-acetylglucosamine diphosphorylase/glucosamine-1-phosphate N-acetyltransferase GlmU [Deltaproteobacteria bacterium]